VKLLVDMNLSPLWVQFFTNAGFESVHWSKIGLHSAPDTEIMDYASTNGYVIFTHDLDFGALLAVRQLSRPSVIQIRAQDILPSAAGEMIIRALTASASYLAVGALVTVDPNRSRIRLLPI